jgi:hypothetical protein
MILTKIKIRQGCSFKMIHKINVEGVFFEVLVFCCGRPAGYDWAPPYRVF